MDNIKIINDLENYISPFPFLMKKWELFYPQLEDYYKNGSSNLLLQRIKLGDILDLKFNKGVNNLIDNNKLKEYDCQYIIKLCLTGKNDLSNSSKKLINNILMEFKLKKEIYTININLVEKRSLAIYPSLISQLSKYSSPLIKGKGLKDIEYQLKSFFSNKLCLPFLMNASYANKRLIAHPITFATYLNMFFIDEKRPYKLFCEKQSNYWRKRAMQVILGLKGIPAISFFQTRISENDFYIQTASKLKNNITNRVFQTNEDNLIGWEKRFFNLIKRKNSLKDLKKSIVTMADEEFHLNTEKKIEHEITELTHKLYKLKTKELLILKEIQQLGGEFKSEKTNKQIDLNNKQFNLFKKPNILSDIDSEKIEQLIANYYINLSKINVLNENIADLQNKKNKSIENIKCKNSKTIKDIELDISSIDQNIKELISKNYKYIIELNAFHDLIIDEALFKRPLNEERKTVIRCMDILRDSYELEHKKILLNFFECLKNNLNYFGFPKVYSISFNRLYMLKISYEKRVVSFNDLTDYQKDIFVICFYLTLFKLCINGESYVPSLLVIYLPHRLRENSSEYVDKIEKLLESNKNFQIIIF